MNTQNIIVIAGLSLSLAAGGCEEKKAETVKAADKAAAGAGALLDKAKETGGTVADAAKDGAAKAMEAGKGAVDAAKEGAAKAVAAASDEVKTAMKGYIDSLGESTGILAKVKGPTDAGQAKPLMESLTKNAGFAALVEKATPEMKTALKGEFGSPLDAAMKAFTAQKDRIMGDGMLKGVFGDALGKFKALAL